MKSFQLSCSLSKLQNQLFDQKADFSGKLQAAVKIIRCSELKILWFYEAPGNFSFTL